jgi:hypothetical protein
MHLTHDPKSPAAPSIDQNARQTSPFRAGKDSGATASLDGEPARHSWMTCCSM